MAIHNAPGQAAPIIIKRYKKGGHEAAHGSSTWKIALADFMTAMFIIFMLLWLIKQSTPEQRSGIADYFAPNSVSRSTSGSGMPLAGRVAATAGALTAEAARLGPPGGGPSTPQEGEGSTDVPGYAGEAATTKGEQVTHPGLKAVR